MDKKRDMTEVFKKKLLSLGFSNIRVRQNKINFSITNQGQSTDDNWKTFLVNIECVEEFFKVTLFFNYNNTIFAFKNSLKTLAVEAIILINKKLPVGQFKLNSAKQTISLKLSAVYATLNMTWWETLAHEYIRLALVLYKSFAFALVKIIGGESNIPELIKECIKRSNGLVSENEPSSSTNSDDEDSSFSFDEQPNKALIKMIQVSKFFQEKFIIQESFEELDFQSGLEFGKGQANFESFLELVQQMFKLGVKFRGLKFVKIMIKSAKSEILKVYIPKYTYFTDIDQADENYFEDYVNSLIIDYNKELADSFVYDPSSLIKRFAVHLIEKSTFELKDIRSNENIIGQGGFGVIYRNYIYRVPVAIKFTKSESTKGKEMVKLINEYKIMQALDHENIIKTFGFVEFDGKFGIVMEMCGGGALNQVLRLNQSINIKSKVEIMLKVIKAIEYMHIKNFCHFDIKPHNILLDDNLNPKLTDLGLSQKITDKQMKKTGFTLIYSSPEQIKGNNLSPKADVWSFGMTMYNSFTGITPYDYLNSENKTKLDKNQFYNEIFNNKRSPRIPENFEIEYPQITGLLRETWKTDPNSRASSKQVRQRLTEILRGLN